MSDKEEDLLGDFDLNDPESMKKFQEKQEKLLGRLVDVMQQKLETLETEMGGSDAIDKALKDAGFNDGIDSLKKTMSGLTGKNLGASEEGAPGQVPDQQKKKEAPLRLGPGQKG